MPYQLVTELSDVSRTNQLKILPNQDLAEKLFQYLFKKEKGIESFELQYRPTQNEYSRDQNSEENQQSNFFQQRHRYIKKQIQERLTQNGVKPKSSDIQYCLSYSDGKTYIFFLSSKKQESRWKSLFKDNRARIFNLVFKFYLIDKFSPNKTNKIISGFE